MEFTRQEYWSGLPCPPPGDLPDPRIKPDLLRLLHWQAGSLLQASPGNTPHPTPFSSFLQPSRPFPHPTPPPSQCYWTCLFTSGKSLPCPPCTVSIPRDRSSFPIGWTCGDTPKPSVFCSHTAGFLQTAYCISSDAFACPSPSLYLGTGTVSSVSELSRVPTRQTQGYRKEGWRHRNTPVTPQTFPSIHWGLLEEMKPQWWGLASWPDRLGHLWNGDKPILQGDRSLISITS